MQVNAWNVFLWADTLVLQSAGFRVGGANVHVSARRWAVSSDKRRACPNPGRSCLNPSWLANHRTWFVEEQ